MESTPSPLRRRLSNLAALAVTVGGLVLAVSTLGTGCITPPALPSAGWNSIDLIDFPPGTEPVRLDLDDGRRLAGVFVPAGPGAPVVVVFSGAMESVTLGCRHDLRVASLAPGEGATGALQETTIGEVGFSLIGSGERRVTVRASLGLPTAPLVRSVSLPSLGIGLTDDLAGRELQLSWQLPDALAERGIATLWVDYGGVGASTGERDVDQLASDARAVWAQALERVGGDPGRVALRGTSLGTLAIATLLDDGVQPAAVVLAAPVRGETVVEHFAHWAHAPLFERMSLPFLDSVTDVDLVEVIDAFTGPLHLVVPEDDALLPREEREPLRRAAARAGSTWAVVETGHETLAIAAHDMLPGESEVYAAAFPDRARMELADVLAAPGVADTPLARADSPARERLLAVLETAPPPTPNLAAALALGDDGVERARSVRRWLRRVPPLRWDDLDLPAARALLEMSDPDGPLDADGLASLATLLVSATGDDLSRLLAEVGEAQDVAISGSVGGEASFVAGERADGKDFRVVISRHGVRVDDPILLATYLLQAAREHELASEKGPGLSAAAADRRTVRRLLKALGIADRVDAAGRVLAWRGGAWEPVALR